MENPELCADPLPKCPGDQAPTDSPKEDHPTHEDVNEKDDDIFPSLYVGVMFGFIVGFCGTSVIKKS